jgi:hypothetical protein
MCRSACDAHAISPHRARRVLIDEYMPRYDVVERHTLEVSGSPAAAYDALLRADFAASGVVRVLEAIRTFPATHLAWRRGSPRRHRRAMTLATLESSGFVRLAAIPGNEIVLGIEGRFWALDGGRCSPPASAFATTAPQPGTARAVWNFAFRAIDPTRTLVSTETRVLCADAHARHRFLPYWFVIRPASGLIRRAMLQQIRDALVQAKPVRHD